MSDNSDDGQSIGYDSCYSDGLVDSELGMVDNETNFGIEVNWGGVGGKGKSSQIIKPSKGKGKEVDKHGGHSEMQSDNIKWDVVFTKNDKNKVQVKCKHDTCKWYIFASKIHGEDTMQVKTLYSEHQCTRVERVSATNSKWLANKYKDKLRTDPKWPVDSMMSVMQKECKLLFSKFQMYRAKGKVAKMSAGSEDQQYGIDGNNCMYPFAYVVVEKEKKSTWLWFLELLLNDLEIPTDSDKWTIMSDKQKGLIDAVDMLLPYCEHRFCVMHLYNNFKVAHKGLGLKMMLWKAAKATRIVDFEKIINELRGKDLEAFKWLAKRPAAHWSRSYFRCNAKYDILLNNMCESFNATIVEARSMPIVDMLETIKMILMKRDQFEVAGCYGDKHNLHLGEKTCSCRKWQLTGIPCAHAFSGMYFMGYKPEDYVHEYYHKSIFLRVYSHLMMPLLGPDEWPHSDRPSLLPPISERMPRRPKKQDRRKTPDEDITKDHVLKVQRINNQRNMLRCLQKEKRKADVMSQESNLTTSRRPLTRSVAALQGKQVEVLPLSQRLVTGPGTPSKTRKKMKVISKAKQGPHNIPFAQQKKKKTEDNVAATSPSKIATSAGLPKLQLQQALPRL
ncbi:UNVERIFIED_CONTAM: hypothetical protein Slati_3952200 [Sesamum latifolium]|uniref:SWIM-type domain-containing protein n=1 Tax=Sesamum latifolium TaxID=2727402 RepID=A0AAW2TQ44_9LAMI